MYYLLSFWKMHFLMGMVSGSFSNPSVHFCKLFTFMSRLTWRALFWMNIFVVSCAGKVINIRRLNEVINSINGWYMERGLFGSVSTEFSLSGFGCVFLALVLVVFSDLIFPFWTGFRCGDPFWWNSSSSGFWSWSQQYIYTLPWQENVRTLFKTIKY